MAARCTFPLGGSAVFDDGRWTSDNSLLQSTLTQITEGMIKGHFPWPEHDIAHEAARRLGGTVTSADPAPEAPDGGEY